MKLKTVFIINLILGSFALLAHVPVVALKLAGVGGLQSSDLWLVMPLIPLDLILVAGSIAALAGSEERRASILSVQAIVLALFGVMVVGMLLWFVMIGFPTGGFSWTPGFGAALVGYSVYVGKRAFYTGRDPRMEYAGWYAAGMVFLFELILMYKFHVVFFS